MANFSVMADIPNPVFDSNGNPFSGAVLKAYLPGTTTSTSIAIDEDGASPQASITYNAAGKLEVSGNEILPYIDRQHKWGVFANATDAAANTPFYMGSFDNVPPGGSPFLINDLSQAYEFATVAEYKAFATAFPVGKIVNILERNAKFKIIAGVLTANIYKIIASDQVDQSADLIVGMIVSLNAFGCVSDWNGTTGTDNSDAADFAFGWCADNQVILTSEGLGYALNTHGITLKSNLHFQGNKATPFVQNYQVIVEPKSESVFVNESWNTEFGEDTNMHLCNLHIINGPGISGGSFITINKFSDYTIDGVFIRKFSENIAMNIGGKDFKLNDITIRNLDTDVGKIDGIHFEYIEDCVLTNFDIVSQDDCVAFAYFPAIVPPRQASEAIANVPWGRDKPSKNITGGHWVLQSDIASAIRVGNWSNFDNLDPYMMPDGRFENMTISDVVFNKVGISGGCIIMQDFRRQRNSVHAGGTQITQPHNELRFNNMVLNDFTSTTEAMFVIAGNGFAAGRGSQANEPAGPMLDTTPATFALDGTDRNYNRIFFNGVSGVHSSAGQTYNINGVSEFNGTALSVSRAVAGDNEMITLLTDRIRLTECFINSVALNATSNTCFFKDFEEVIISGGQIKGTGLEVAAVRLDQPNLLSGGRVILQSTILDGQVGGVHSVGNLVLDELQIDANIQGLSGLIRNTNLSAVNDDTAPMQNLHANVTLNDQECQRSGRLGLVTGQFVLSAQVNDGEKVADFPPGVTPRSIEGVRFQLINTSGVEYQCDYGPSTGVRARTNLVAGTYYINESFRI